MIGWLGDFFVEWMDRWMDEMLKCMLPVLTERSHVNSTDDYKDGENPARSGKETGLNRSWERRDEEGASCPRGVHSLMKQLAAPDSFGKPA